MSNIIHVNFIYFQRLRNVHFISMILWFLSLQEIVVVYLTYFRMHKLSHWITDHWVTESWNAYAKKHFILCSISAKYRQLSSFKTKVSKMKRKILFNKKRTTQKSPKKRVLTFMVLTDKTDKTDKFLFDWVKIKF